MIIKYFMKIFEKKIIIHMKIFMDGKKMYCMILNKFIII